MIGELLRVGDRVLVKVAEENREWGYDPAPDGTEVEIVRFGEIDYGRTHNFGYEPGIYANPAWADVRLPNGEVIHMGTFHLEPRPEDEGLFAGRTREWRENTHTARERLRDLPETPFWEGDIVMCPSFDSDDPEKHYVISGINYLDRDRKTLDGSPWPFYQISDSRGGWHSSVREDELTLVARGNVWKFHHEEDIEFSDVREEAELHSSLGKTQEVRNPASGLYAWTIEEALDAIQGGLGDAVQMSGGMFGAEPRPSVRRFEDREVGERVRAATLEGFGRQVA